MQDKGEPDAVAPQAEQHAARRLAGGGPDLSARQPLLRDRSPVGYAWSLFGQVPKGWPLVQAICDYVHDRITFGYQHASPTKTALDAYTERRGVCRDFAHLAVTLCRCMNIPARYCTGYLGDMGAPPPYDARWISPLGSRPISEDAGIPSIRATTCRASAAS